jgi:hypothetical protein
MQWVRVYTALNAFDAHAMRLKLAIHGITSIIQGQNFQNLFGSIMMIPGTLPSVWVHPDAAAEARQLISPDTDADSSPGQPWICPNCHETVEDQFTDCWNCLTPRHTETLGPAPDVIEDDLPCARCGDNLRFQSPIHRCPECGTYVAFSIQHAISMLDATSLHRLLRHPFELAAPVAGWPADAMLLVFQACHRATINDGQFLDPNKPLPIATAPGICRALRDVAVETFNSERHALACLLSWKIRTTDDLVSIIQSMISANLLDPATLPPLVDLHHLDTMQHLFAQT